MYEYDVTLKKLLQTSADSILNQALGGLQISRWLNVELLPPSQTRRADLVGETAAGALVHIELQSSNDPAMAFRMAEYSLRIYGQFGKFPKQLVLYVGEPAMRMSASLQGPHEERPDVSFQYVLVDFRDLDGTALLNSPSIEANLLSILARLRDQRSAVQDILYRIARLDEPRRRDLFANFLILSGLRKLGQIARKEAQKMPILNSILDHDVIGPAILQGRLEGREEGLQQGIQEGRREGRSEGRNEGRAQGLADVAHRLLEKRFGPLPASVDNRLAGLSAPELEDLAVRLLDAPSLESVFPR